ncbi:MAG: NUDIX domain-containing protein [Candidatus Thermoplasmatota archaeon]|nr:NUDIX domain-containing protein [Candidatus Thermoplasmatota archaeon]
MPDVVTCIILFRGKMLLLKRSNKVGTHKGKWACISGYVEEGDDILERALSEVEEEIGLSQNEIKLQEEGKPIKFFDEIEEKTWTVHPFLFKSNTDKIEIDWEHVGYVWITPSEIEKYDTVPKLKEVVNSFIPWQ